MRENFGQSEIRREDHNVKSKTQGSNTKVDTSG